MRTRLNAIAAAVIVGLGLTACGGGGTDTAGGDAGGDTQEIQPLVAGVIPVTDIGPVYMAQQNGLFEENGFDLTLHDLEVFAARFEAQVASDIDGNPEIAAYARRVAEQEDEDDEEPEVELDEPIEELPDAATMVDELERFLRDQREGPEN